MRRFLLFGFVLLSVVLRSQTDTSYLDKLTPEELLQHYLNEKEIFYGSKGPEGVGDSLYNELNPLVIPTQTVHAASLYRTSQSDKSARVNLLDSIDNAEQKLKPKISLGAGRLGFYGDLYQKQFQSPMVSRPAFDLNISQRLNRYLQLNFNVMFGKLGANEQREFRQENFQSEIRAGGVNLLYDFGNFIPDRYTVRPFVSAGIAGFEFLSKTDIKDANGNVYYYWSDGSIKSKAENAADAHTAIDLKRDYVYETDVRERNADGFGKYRESAIAIPVGVGFLAKVTDRIDLKLNFQVFFTNTDYIDGISSKSIGNRIGDKKNDNFSYLSFAVQYDLIAKPASRAKLQKDTLNDSFWFAMDTQDSDGDKVPDIKDECHGTPEGVPVDEKGCPLDDDNDGIPNYRDDEPNTLAGSAVDDRGVALDAEHWQAWYNQYQNDSLGTDPEEEIVGNFYKLDPKKPKGKKKKDVYTVELARYQGSIPSDELAFLLSIGDIKSITLGDGTTVVYTAGEYDKVMIAIQRRDEFRAEGNKGAGVSKIVGKDVIAIPEEELADLLNKELLANPGSETTNNNSVSTTSTTSTGTVSNGVGTEETFNKSDIVYRVQLGAFKNKISTSVFNTSAGVLELKTGENVYRYVTRGYKTIEEAASTRADLVIQGYSDAFVTAYKDGKRIPMSQTKATMDKTYKEDMNENKIFSSVNKSLVAFKVQLGPAKKPAAEKMMDERIKDVKGVEKQATALGTIRYTAGKFTKMDAAEAFRKELEDKGFTDAFIIATFRDEVISIQEAAELLK
jgi:hypothetical protein